MKGLLYAVGDSITYGANNEGVSYVDKACDMLGLVCKKFAVSGATWVYTLQDDGNPRGHIGKQVKDMLSLGIAPDYIVLSGGYNDSQLSILNPVGNIGLVNEQTTVEEAYGGKYDINTVAGSIEDSIYHIKLTYPHARLLYVITYRVAEQYHWTEKYVPAIRSVLHKWAIPYVDFTQCGNLVCASCLPEFHEIFTDGIHPNDQGHEIMSRYVAKKLDEI